MSEGLAKELAMIFEVLELRLKTGIPNYILLLLLLLLPLLLFDRIW